MPPSVTRSLPSEANDQPSAPVKPEQREPLVPSQNWLVLSALPAVLSLEPLLLRHDVLPRNTELPVSNEKLRSSLSMLRLFDTVIALANGEKLIVRDAPDDIVSRVQDYKRSLLASPVRERRGEVTALRAVE